MTKISLFQKKGSYILIFIIQFYILLSPIYFSGAQELTKEPDTTDIKRFSIITEKIKLASEGNTVKVPAGRYRMDSHPTINKSINLIADPQNSVHIEKRPGYSESSIYIETNNIRISGFIFYDTFLRIRPSLSNITIDHNEFNSSPTLDARWISYEGKNQGKNIIIANNSFNGARGRLDIFDCKLSGIENNIFNNCRVTLDAVSNSRIFNNTFQVVKSNLHSESYLYLADKCSDIKVQNNSFIDCGTGMAIDLSNGQECNVIIRNNSFISNGIGILLYNPYENNYEENNIFVNTTTNVLLSEVSSESPFWQCLIIIGLFIILIVLIFVLLRKKWKGEQSRKER